MVRLDQTRIGGLRSVRNCVANCDGKVYTQNQWITFHTNTVHEHQM